jgi:hypothetical protein
MQADHLIIGSGLSALAVALGLPAAARVVVVAGAGDVLQTYPANRSPASFLGQGGLGNYWHGILPMAREATEQAALPAIRGLLAHLYPGLDVGAMLGTDQILVPWRPVRPRRHWQALAGKRSTLTVVDGMAERFALGDGAAEVTVSASGERRIIRAGRVWLAAGALHSPGILARSLGWAERMRMVSDHMIGYVGQAPAGEPIRAAMAGIRRDRHGVWLPALYNQDRSVVYGARPARFDFRTLDRGIAMRADFGLPTSRAAAAIAGRLSPGLVAETLFNKAGLFPRADLYNIVFQARVADAYPLSDDGVLGAPVPAAFAATAEQARAGHPFAGLVPSARPQLYQPGIHLHNSLDAAERQAITGLDRLRVVDASAVPDIGPEHHSFRIMLAAYAAAVEGS